MKRRLSCAISLIGAPDVTFLDEPSTGLDPASRRALWNVVSAAKGNKSIILTTHSMEEADVLCDRIAIMAHGEVQCVGTAASLKRRFGRGYTLMITGKDKSDEVGNRVDTFVRSMFPTAKLLQEPIAGSRQYEICRTEVVLSDVFTAMNDDANREKVGFVDWGFTETTLEEVFLKLALLSKIPKEKRMKRSLSDLAQDSTLMAKFKTTRTSSMRDVDDVDVSPSSNKGMVAPLEVSSSK